MIDRKFHRLGTDRKAAEAQFNFQLRQSFRHVRSNLNPLFAEIADGWLGHVKE